MAPRSGITANTYQHFVIDAGALYKNWGESSVARISATRGGNEFKIEREQRNMEVDGARGFVVGGKRNTNVTASITANLIELANTSVLDIVLPGVTKANYGSPKTHNQYTQTADIATSNYITNIAIVGDTTYNGNVQPAVFIIYNALADGNLTMTCSDKEEGVVAVTFFGHFDPASLDTEPWKILMPGT